MHFVFVALLMGQTILYDASKLATPEVVFERWAVATLLLAVTVVIWYLVRSRSAKQSFYKSLLGVIIFSDILLASYFVYTGRGMASRAVILYVIPIIISGLLKSRSAIYATAILSIAAYSLTAVAYFVFNFNEGYKVELYGEVGFYSLLMLLIAGLLARALKTRV